MCGRYGLVLDAVGLADAVTDRFPAADVDWHPRDEAGHRPRYNVAPGTRNPVVIRAADDGIRRFRWGLVPEWADADRDGGHINARAETVDERPSFRASFADRRCLVPAQGFYEWRDRDDGAGEPYRIVPRDAPDDLFLFAGIWSEWTPATEQTALDGFGDGGADAEAGDGAEGGADARRSYAILTVPADGAVAPIHDRMPVMLRGDALATWLAGTPDEARAVLDDVGLPDDGLRAYPVTRAVNDASNDGPALWRPLDE